MIPKPVGKDVTIEVVQSQSTSGPIILLEKTKGKPVQGLIRAIGSQVVELQVGDYVLFPEHNRTNIKTDSGNYVVISEDDVSCKLEPEDYEVEGLLHEDLNRQHYFPATISSALFLIRQTLEDHRPRLTLKEIK